MRSPATPRLILKFSCGRMRHVREDGRPQAVLRFGTALAGIALTAVAVAVALAPVAPAGAETSVAVSTDPTGAHVRLARRGTWIELRATGGGSGSGGSGATTGCQRRWVPTKYPRFLNPGRVDPDIHYTPMPPAPSPDDIAYYVYCDGTYVTSVWLAPNAFAPAAGAVDVLAIAEQLVRDLPYPDATVRVSPEGRGLTGLESWFWVDGYTGTVSDAVDELGVHVEVEAVPASVRWSFGDGTPAQPGTLGVAAPTRSDVVHTFEQRSRASSIRASVRLEVRFRVDGEEWQTLDPVFRIAARTYPVAESRAALVAPR